jgi:hypothetical protein
MRGVYYSACSLCYKAIAQFHQKCLLMRDCVLFRRLLLPESTVLIPSIVMYWKISSKHRCSYWAPSLEFGSSVNPILTSGKIKDYAQRPTHYCLPPGFKKLSAPLRSSSEVHISKGPSVLAFKVEGEIHRRYSLQLTHD